MQDDVRQLQQAREHPHLRWRPQQIPEPSRRHGHRLVRH